MKLLLAVSTILATVLATPTPGKPLKPIFFLHGIGGHASDADEQIAAINKQYPGTWTHSIKKFQGNPISWLELDDQIFSLKRYVKDIIRKDPSTFADGYHFVCHSQGGLLCRTLIQDWDDHNVRVFVGMAGPQRGVFGLGFVDFLDKINIPDKEVIEKLGLREIYRFMYLNDTQDMSWANMWHDPFQEELFKDEDRFLPKFNGLVGDPTRYKTNLMKLEKAVFVVGGFENSYNGDRDNRYDGGIDPWDSGVWDYYPTGKTSTMRRIEPLEHSEIWLQDTIGLRAMDRDGSLFRAVYPGAVHSAWWHNSTVYENYVFPHLN